MKNLNEVIAALKAQMNEVENMFNNQKNQEITFTREELIEYTKTIANVTANGMVHEISQTEKFNFKPALFTVRENGELVVKGDICIYDDWYQTKDKVKEVDGVLFYLGRTNKEVDFNNPTKGL